MARVGVLQQKIRFVCVLQFCKTRNWAKLVVRRPGSSAKESDGGDLGA